LTWRTVGLHARGMERTKNSRRESVALPPPLAVFADEEPEDAWYAQAIMRVLAKAREVGITPLLGPDATAEVILRYVNGEPVGAAQVAVSVEHSYLIDSEEVREVIRRFVLLVLPNGWMCDEENFVVNGFVESKAPVYTDEMDAAAFAAAARTFSDRELKEYVQKGEVAAAVLRERETTSRSARDAPRPDLPSELVAAMLKGSILGRLQEKFEKQLHEIELPEGGFNGGRPDTGANV
jgi:hypothetical protein